MGKGVAVRVDHVAPVADVAPVLEVVIVLHDNTLERYAHIDAVERVVGYLQPPGCFD